MRIYLAASWPQRKTMRDIADHLQAIGHIVTSTWIYSESPKGMDAGDVTADPDRARKGGNRDLSDIRESTMAAIFTDVPSSTGGFHVEYGYALASGKLIAIVGPQPNVFYSLNKISITHHKDAIAFFDYLHSEEF
jgi:hypothetical protein